MPERDTDGRHGFESRQPKKNHACAYPNCLITAADTLFYADRLTANKYNAQKSGVRIVKKRYATENGRSFLLCRIVKKI